MDNLNKKLNKIWLVLAPDYGNIGDIAIALAQRKIINDVYPTNQIVEIPMMNYFEHKDQMKNNIADEDIITIIGGGNMGNLYLGFEEKRRDIVQSFPNNKIISFPQSISFEDSEVGQTEFQNSLDIYKNHTDLSIFIRENLSYDKMKKRMDNVIIVPDTVMYLTDKIEKNPSISRDKIMLCFRNDREKVTENDIIEETVELFNHHEYRDIEIMDTHLGEIRIKPEEKEEIFDSIIKKFQSAKLVITDRLHGMIFALITKTPCIALDNSTKKISATYHTWLENIPFMRLVKSYDKEQILAISQELMQLNLNLIQINFDKEFKPLIDTLKDTSLL
ncbi:MAG: polysaccharide pyruvyl transferase family protein [Clostridia bacterium]|nr:polysaccharide pyruvyl transferase family protein [Clostridia bacterium]